MTHIFRGRALRALPGLVLVAVLAAGCNTDELVEVEDPEQLRPDQISGASAVPALVNGALRQFIGGYSGFGLDDSFLSMTAVMSDEFYFGDTFTTRQAADRRQTQPAVLGNISDASFSRLHQARFNARRAYASVAKFTTTATADEDIETQSFLRAIEGYTYVTLSEGWCGAVPFSVLPDEGEIDPGAVEHGVPLTTNQMNEQAIVRFDEALALDAGNRLAILGKARALLNLGRYADAATTVAGVPTTFAYRLEHSSNAGSQNNPIFDLQSNGRYGISNLEGSTVRPDTPSPTMEGTSAEGLPFRAAQDPRIPYTGRGSRGTCFSSSVRCWVNLNYPDEDADVTLASGVEARLIEAEAAFANGDPVTGMAKLNALRADATANISVVFPNQIVPNPFAGDLAPLTDPGTAAGRRDLVFRERAFWLFNTGHRLGDLRRLVRNYGLPQSSVFPTGPHFRGGNYGTDVSYPVPFNEENNENFKREACVTSQA